ncbi:hypothetical protein LZ519_10695 [Sphingomonas sp. RG327]|uniref:DUF3035 domain-containing protein n=1 Tax=Sphingomonas anseongensis TaxID=2908207 RepID=A0ABT0RHP0_9SPHN|nr:hypothetical protein [Sphingomonas anseongensis]MCL6679777.1 hypothetical protein [Sphingomonas anseongensis]
MSASRYLRLAGAAAILCLAGCGKMADLEPAKVQPLPVKPLMARATPTPNELLSPPAYANPDRIDELMKRSTPRQSDRFDLPPPTGKAPTLPVEELNNEMTNTVGPVTPQ